MQDKNPESKALEDNVVIVPTPPYVKDSIKEAIDEHAQSRNHPYATQTEPGFVTLSNEVDSDSGLTVATSQAVKKAYDLANTANQNTFNNNANLYLKKAQNGADIPDKSAFVNNIGLQGTVELAKNALSKSQNGADIPNKLAFAQNIGALVANNAVVNDPDRGRNNVPNGDYNNLPTNQIFFGYLYGKNSGGVTGPGMHFTTLGGDYSLMIQAGYNGGGRQLIFRTRNGDSLSWNPWWKIWHTGNTTVVDGHLKIASPIIKITDTGVFETNDESEGAIVERLSEGIYLIKNVLGFNSDAAWGGIDGGIEIPLCKNKLPLIWVDYRALSDGTIKLMTYHREHADAPAFARNIREGYADGDPIDIPSGRFISVRVQMPENSIWNQKQKLAESE